MRPELAAAAAPEPAVPARPGEPAAGVVRPLLLSAAVVALFFAPALIGDGQFLHRDNGRMHHPDKRWIAAELSQGRLPEWNPLAGLGTPVLAGGIDAVQHPFTLLLVALPFELGFKLWIVFSYVLAAFGAWSWARRLGAPEAAAAAAGLGFALSGFLVSSSDNATYLTTMAAVPLVFAAAHDWLERPSPARLLLVGLASGLCAAGGDAQGWVFAVGGLPVYAWLVGPRSCGARSLSLRTLAAISAAAIGAAPFILPLALWIPYSARSESFDWVDYVRYNLLPARLAELVVPHLFHPPENDYISAFSRAYGGPYTPVPWVLSEYVGAASLALAALGARRSATARRLLVVAALFAWMALGHHAGFGQLARKLPLLSNFRYWEKVAAWIALLVPAAAALGVNALIKGPERSARRFAVVSAAAGVSFLTAWACGAAFPAGLEWLVRPPQDPGGVATAMAGNVREGLVHAGAVLVLLALAALALGSQRLRRLAPVLLAMVVTGDLAAANVRAYVLSPSALSYGASPFAEFLKTTDPLPRVVTPFEIGAIPVQGATPIQQRFAWASRALYSGWNIAEGVGNFESYSALWPVRATRHRRRAGLVKQLPGVGLWGVSHTVVPGRPEHAASMNLRPPYRIAAADPVLDAVLLEIRHRPRAYLAREVIGVDRRAAMNFALDDTSVAGDRTVVEGPVPADYAPPDGDATIAADAPTRVAVRTRASRPALLVLNDAYAEPWTATVDGEPAPIVPTNYLARGVWVAAGEHEVVFRYRTAGLREGWALFAVGVLAVGGWALLRGRRPTSRGHVS